MTTRADQDIRYWPTLKAYLYLATVPADDEDGEDE